MRNFSYTALTPLKVGGVVVKQGEQVVLEEATGAGLVDDGLLEQASDEAVEVQESAPSRVVSKPAAQAAGEKKAKERPMDVTPANLAGLPGAQGISQVASTEHDVALVDAALVDLTLRGEDRSEYPPADVAAADVALARVEAAIGDADATIEGYLRMRGYALPLDPVPPIVTTWARAITRYFLHKHLLSTEAKDPIVRDYQDALKFLKLVAAGQFSLGAGDVIAPTGTGSPQVCAPARVFTPDTLADFTGS